MDSKNNPTPEPRRALGRGLAALLRTNNPNVALSQTQGSTLPSSLVETSVKEVAPPAPLPSIGGAKLQLIELSKIEANPEQPRKHFNEERLQELALSLMEQGLIQPIVCKKVGDDKYQIIAGERRWRASKIAGLTEIPVLVRDEIKNELENDLASLIENLQREELNAIELAQSYERLIKVHQFTQEALAEKLGVSRVSVANTLRLLKLPKTVQDLVVQGQLGEGHSRALLSLENDEQMLQMAEKIMAEKLSVREVENQVRVTVVGRTFANPESSKESSSSKPAGQENAADPSAGKKPDVLALEDQLRQLFGTKVVVRGNGERGTLEIYYSGADSFHRIVHQLRSLQK